MTNFCAISTFFLSSHFSSRNHSFLAMILRNSPGLLPESFGELARLKKLIVYENSLRALPDSIGRLGALEGLDASTNQLEALPESVGELATSDKPRRVVRSLPSWPLHLWTPR